ncbi:MAG: CPBP family intramembrane glutamic endopeptidase [Hyphomicrobiaceae bacterium]
MIKNWGARHPIIGFLAFSHGWTFGWWAVAGVLALSNAGTVWSGAAAIAFYIGGAGVLIGGVAMPAMHFGSAGLADLGRRIIDPRPIRPQWWTFILLFFPLITVAAAVMAGFAGLDAAISPLGDITGLTNSLPAFLAFVGFILLVGPLPEEIGWRGYLLDRLLAAQSPVMASLVMAVIWWSWHLPLPWLPGYFEAFAREPPGPLFMLISLVPAAIVYTWLFLHTGHSVLAVILFHWVGNLTGQILLPSHDVRLVRLALEYAVAMGIVAWWLYRRTDPPLRDQPA